MLCNLFSFLNTTESCRQIEEGNFLRSSVSTTSSTSIPKDGNGAKNSSEILMLCERSLYVLKVRKKKKIEKIRKKKKRKKRKEKND